MTSPILTPRSRALAVAMRNAREAVGIGQRELARRLGISQPQLSFWERGLRVPKLEDVASVLACIGVTGNERERVLELARHAAEPNWLAGAVPGISPAMAAIVDCERTATNARQWSPSLIPGLLQTSDYARAIISNAGLTPDQVEARLFTRMARRDAITRREPLEFTALVGQAAFLDMVGGPAVMVDQLRYVAEVAGRRNVSVRVIPPGIGWHPGLTGPFVIYSFLDTPSIVHIEHQRSSAFLYEEDLVESFHEAVATMQELALDEQETSTLVQATIDDLEKVL